MGQSPKSHGSSFRELFAVVAAADAPSRSDERRYAAAACVAPPEILDVVAEDRMWRHSAIVIRRRFVIDVGYDPHSADRWFGRSASGPNERKWKRSAFDLPLFD